MIYNKFKVLFTVLYLYFTFFANFVFAESNEDFVSKEDAYLVKKLSEKQYNPKEPIDIPAFMKGFTADYLPEDINLRVHKKDTDAEKLEFIKKHKPENYLDYSKVLCPLIMKETKKPKKLTSFKLNDMGYCFFDMKNHSDFDYFKKIENLIHFWTNYVSLLLELDGNDNAAIVLSYGSYYFTRFIEENSRGISFKLRGAIFSDIVSKKLLKILSKPRMKSVEINKYLAKDLLELVKNDYLYSDCFKYERAMIYYAFYVYIDKKYENNELSAFYIFNQAMLNNALNKQFDSSEEKDKYLVSLAEKLLKSDYFKEIDNLFFIEPKRFIDKPYYLCKTELESYFKKTNNKLKEMWEKPEKINNIIDVSKSKNIPDKEIELKIGPNKDEEIIIDSAFECCIPKYLMCKEYNERKLEAMDVVAIALAYNAFYCENKKEPANIEELEKWFGEKLPINRLTGKPYEFYTEDGYVIYNFGLDGKKDDSDDKSLIDRDIFFSFSK